MEKIKRKEEWQLSAYGWSFQFLFEFPTELIALGMELHSSGGRI